MEKFPSMPKAASNVAVTGNYFKVNVTNKIIKMKVEMQKIF